MKKLALIAFILAACGGGSPPPRVTIGETCAIIGSAICGRATVCGIITTTSDSQQCRSTFYASCCGDAGNCNVLPAGDVTTADVDVCSNAIAVESCSTVIVTLPAICATVLQ